MNLFIIIPAFNEEKNIAKVIKSIKAEFENSTIVVVDDGSKDNTIQEVLNSDAILLRHIINRGQGASLQTGNEFCIRNNADIIVHFDGDGQHQVKDIKNLIDPILNENIDVSLGSRFLSNESEIPWSKKFFILKPAIWVNLFFTGIKLTDVHNGFRAMTKDSAIKIKITQDKMAHSTEIISEIKRNKLNFKEVPVKIIYNEYGQGIFDGIKILKDLIIKKIL